MRRRDFMKIIGGAAAAWPRAVRAQQATIPVIGFLGSSSAAPNAHFVAAFHQGLDASGYVEGRNVAIEYRWADNQYDRLRALAAELVRLQVAVIVASGGPVTPTAAKDATSTIPIVFTASSDPVKLGLVASLNRPGGNLTGSGIFTIELDPKRLELLRELVPTARVIGVLINPGRTDAETQARSVQEAGRILGLQVIILRTSNERDIDTAFTRLARQRIGALLIGADPVFLNWRDQLLLLAARRAVPVIANVREITEAGGLASYGPSIADGYRQAGIYTGQILKGAKPRDLPVVQPTKFELVINLKTAKALGLTVPPTLLAIADEVIE
jgi:putative tryptophan/tyrosine transport system substrate-binding protein